MVTNIVPGVFGVTHLLENYPEARIVHRLDMNTSGIMVIALSKESHRNLSIQFEKRNTYKEYVAVLFGKLEKDAGTIELPLICDWPNRPKQKICYETGRAAITDWRVIKRLETETRIKLTPKTGRSHQLRIHMLALGHPILGDPFYGTPDSQNAERLMLHSYRLSLRHPDGGEMMEFRAKQPF